MNILIVDNYEKFGKVLKNLLAKNGHSADYVLNGRDAIKKIKEQKYDMILLDMVMPEMNGIATLRQIRQFNTHIKIVMISRYSMSKASKNTEEYNVHSFLYKPISIRQILSVIE